VSCESNTADIVFICAAEMAATGVKSNSENFPNPKSSGRITAKTLSSARLTRFMELIHTSQEKQEPRRSMSK